ncbi:MAG: hypothetical protein ACREXM_06265 [Gammaproteobacteria bacterium]
MEDAGTPRGGIRDIEFIGQTFQLIRGGHRPALRERRILAVFVAARKAVGTTIRRHAQRTNRSVPYQPTMTAR